MNVEIGTEASLFPEKEYIIGIFLAVWNNVSFSWSMEGTRQEQCWNFRIIYGG
jgi:hypothetical protein